MRELTSTRAWEYAYRKDLEEELARNVKQLEARVPEDYQWLIGKIHGIRYAIDKMSEIRAEYRLDDDADMRE